VPDVGLLRVGRAALAGRGIERQVVQPPVRREHEIRRDIAIARLHHDQDGAAIRPGRGRGDLPALSVAGDLREHDLAGLKLDHAGAEYRAGERGLGVPVGERQEVALDDRSGDPARLVLARRGGYGIADLAGGRRIARRPPRIARSGGRGEVWMGRPATLLPLHRLGDRDRDDQRRHERPDVLSFCRHHGFTPSSSVVSVPTADVAQALTPTCVQLTDVMASPSGLSWTASTVRGDTRRMVT
jgi:hypothetical protein